MIVKVKEWAELDENGRDKLVNEMVTEKLGEDIGWSVAE